MDKILAMIFDPAGLSFLITPEEFEEICENRKFKNTDDLKKIIKIAVYDKHGELLEEDPHYNAESFTETLQKIEIKEKAPDYIKKSPLVTHLKYALWKSNGPDWAKQQLATKSYISFQPQKDIDELVEKKEYQETNGAEIARRIAELLHKSSEKAQNALTEKLTLLEKIELLTLREAIEHYNQFGILKKELSVLAEAEEK
jgi:Glu-tRNA(Gln) amidotransferase subunit E-like FAD-binding protein